MDRAQVVGILGEPDFTEKKDGAEILHYLYREDYNPPLTDNSAYERNHSRNLQQEQLLRSTKEYHYTVIMVDGRVLDYKDLKD